MTDFLKKIKQLDAEISDFRVHKQALKVEQIVLQTRQKEILKSAPKSIGFLPDEMEQILSQIDLKAKPNLKIINQLFNSLRQFLSINCGVWSLPNLTTARLIKDQLRIGSALEIMAGNAYWAKALSQAGIKTVATDSLEWSKTSKTGSRPIIPILDLNAAEAIKRFSDVDLVICSWAPNFDQSDLQVVKAWKEFNPTSHLLFIGEKNGVTNSPQFWQRMKFKNSYELKKINRSFTSFDFIDEQIFEIEHAI